MKADAFFVIACLIFIFIAWIATGGPSRPISHSGPFITPVTAPGEESQGYRGTPPANPINPGAYPQVIQAGDANATSTAHLYDRTPTPGN